MKARNALGKYGEDLAAQWLLAKGFIVLHRNWRHSHAEIDLIASYEQVLHFIEVKCRRTQRFGLPEQSIDDGKLKSLLKGADAFQWQYPQWTKISLDVLSIILLASGEQEYYFIEDLYPF